jgi:hypothetical protein
MVTSAEKAVTAVTAARADPTNCLALVEIWALLVLGFLALCCPANDD